jgi:hypothetical protein
MASAPVAHLHVLKLPQECLPVFLWQICRTATTDSKAETSSTAATACAGWMAADVTSARVRLMATRKHD